MRSLKIISKLLIVLIIICATIVGTYFVLLANGVINTEKYQIEITVENSQKVYDGTPLTASNYTITQKPDSFINNEYSLSVTYEGSQTDVGESYASASVKVLDKNQYDISSEFQIKVNPGTLTVTQKNLEITANDVSATSGDDLSKLNSYTITDGSLVNGHTLDVKYTNTDSSISIVASVFNKVGAEVTNNYNITCVDGELELSKQTVYITFSDYTKEYDGESIDFTKIKYSLPSVLDGIEFSFTSKKQILNVGSYAIDDLSYTYKNTNNVDLSNYNIVLGTLNVEITKKPITVIWENNTFTYDGDSHTPKAYIKVDENLIELKVSGSATNAGDNKVATASFKDDSLKDNYELTNEITSIIITKATLSVTWGKTSFVYDTVAHTPKAYAIIDGKEIPLEVEGSATNVKDEEFATASLESKYSANYELSNRNTPIIITPCKVTIAYGTLYTTDADDAVASPVLSITSTNSMITKDNYEDYFDLSSPISWYEDNYGSITASIDKLGDYDLSNFEFTVITGTAILVSDGSNEV